MKRITLLGHINTFTGYGCHSIEIVRGLERLADVHVAIRALSRNERFGANLPTDILSKMVSYVQPEEWELLVYPPHFTPTPGKRTAYFTMFESTRLNVGRCAALNKADVVIVPSAWNASTFSASGVNSPIRIVPLGVNPFVFNLTPHPKSIDGLCVFGSAGRTVDGARARKGIPATIEAFLCAFPNQSDVRLKIKCLPDDIPIVSDPRIEVTAVRFTDQEIAQWISGLHCFVSSAKGEGWGLFQHQAMAVGRPVISVKFGGVAEFLDESCGYPVEFKLEESSETYRGCGHWACPMMGSLVEQMRSVYSDRNESIWRGRRAAERVAPLTWDNSNLKLLDVLHEFGALNKPRARSGLAGSGIRHAVIVYLPPPGIGNSEFFLKNLAEHPPAGDLVILSDHPWPNAVRIPDPTKSCKSSNSIASFVFLHALEYSERRGLEFFIWLESDCRVSGFHWDSQVVSEFSKSDSAIGGGNLAMFGEADPGSEFDNQLEAIRQKYVVDYASKSFSETAVLVHGAPSDPLAPFVNGAPSIFSVERLRQLIGDCDISVATEALPIQDLSLGQIAVNKHGLGKSLSKWMHLPAFMGTAGENIYSFTTRMSALSSKKCAAVHPIKNRWRPPPEDGYTFYSSGNIGDLIYALKAIQAIGGGRLVLGPSHNVTDPPQHPITRSVYEMLVPLLANQPFVKGARYSEKWVDCSYDLDDLRALWRGRGKGNANYDNLCHMLHHVVGVEQLFNPDPWLTAGQKKIASVIIHRSPRSHSSDAIWPAVLNLCRDAVFVGLPDEHEAFCKDFKSRIPYYRVKDFGEMADIINGAEWFVGNQSFPLAIALGLGKNVYQETWSHSPDCIFDRKNFHNQNDIVGVIK